MLYRPPQAKTGECQDFQAGIRPHWELYRPPRLQSGTLGTVQSPSMLPYLASSTCSFLFCHFLSCFLFPFFLFSPSTPAPAGWTLRLPFCFHQREKGLKTEQTDQPLAPHPVPPGQAPLEQRGWGWGA